jgi:hypothetical protein
MQLDPHGKDHAALAAVLVHERMLLARLRYRHRELRLLIEVGEARFLGRAVDRVEDLRADLTDAEQIRGVISASLARETGLPANSDLRALAHAAPNGLSGFLVALGGQLRNLLAEVEDERHAALMSAHARLRRAEVRPPRRWEQ